MSRARDPSTSITLGEMRSLGCRDLLVYCRSVEKTVASLNCLREQSAPASVFVGTPSNTASQ
jgi:hypothetical protein